MVAQFRTAEIEAIFLLFSRTNLHVDLTEQKMNYFFYGQIPAHLKGFAKLSIELLELTIRERSGVHLSVRLTRKDIRTLVQLLEARLSNRFINDEPLPFSDPEDSESDDSESDDSDTDQSTHSSRSSGYDGENETDREIKEEYEDPDVKIEPEEQNVQPANEIKKESSDAVKDEPDVKPKKRADWAEQARIERDPCFSMEKYAAYLRSASVADDPNEDSDEV